MSPFGQNVAANVVAGLIVAAVVFFTAVAWTEFWKWISDPTPRRESGEEVFSWVWRVRWWINSTYEQKLTANQWLAWYIYCPLEGHHFPRGLPNNVGRWNIGADVWFGRCDKCTALLQADFEAKLDEMEQKGVMPWRPRKRIRGKRPKRHDAD